MKRALLLVCCGALSACFPFDDRVDDLCDAGLLIGCPTGADAGTDAGLDDAGAVSFDGGPFCKNAWCWENPARVPGVNLGSIWGTSDTDVWVAGGSGVVAHYDGTTWSPTPLRDAFAGDTVVDSVAVDREGVVSFCGDKLRPAQFTDGQLDVLVLQDQTFCSAVDSWNGVTVFLSLSVDDTSWVKSEGSGSVEALSLLTAPTGSHRHGGVAIDDDASISVIETDTSTIARNDDTRGPLTLPDGGLVDTVMRLRRDPNGTVRALGNHCETSSQCTSTLGVWSGTAWVGTERFTGVALSDLAAERLSTGETQWLYVGDTGFIGASSDTGPVRTLASTTDGVGNSIATWLSPTRTVWTAGEGGQVLRLKRTADGGFGAREVVSQQPQFAIQDLWLNGTDAYAAGDNGTVWTKGADGGWSFTTGFNGAHIIAYVRTGRGSVTLHEDGYVRLGDGGVIGAQLPLVDSLNVRSGGLAVTPDGGVLIAWGSVVYRTTNFSTYTQDSNWSEFTHATDVVVEPSGDVWFSNVSVSNSSFVDGGVTHYFAGDAGGGNGTVYSGEPVYAVALATDGGVFALGHQHVLRCDSLGCQAVRSSGSSQPVSLWVDAQNRAWVLDRDGRVCWGDAFQGWSCDDPFWSGGDYLERLPLRIRGTADRVYVVGGYGNIISRPLPP